jgi:glycosyltransferase involved in cell wall biosynthesis
MSKVVDEILDRVAWMTWDEKTTLFRALCDYVGEAEVEAALASIEAAHRRGARLRGVSEKQAVQQVTAPFVIIDPSVGYLAGHPLPQAAALMSSLGAVGSDCILFAQRNLPPNDLVPESHLRRHFSASLYAEPSTDSISGTLASVQSLSSVLADEIAAAVAQMSNGPYHLIFPTVNAVMIVALRKLLQRHRHLFLERDILMTILLYHECGVRLDDHKGLIAYDTLLAHLWRSALTRLHMTGDRVRVFAVSQEMAEIYSYVARRHIRAVPPFQSVPRIGMKELLGQTRDGPPRVLLFGGQALSRKGFELTAELAAALFARFDDVEGVVQLHSCTTPEHARVADRLRGIAQSSGRLKILEGFLSEADMKQVLFDCDIAVLAYDTQVYAGRTSGLLWEAIASGLIVVTPANTWLARECDNYGAPCLSHASNSVEEIIEAVSDGVRRFDELRPLALKAAQRFSAETGPDILVNQYLAR